MTSVTGDGVLSMLLALFEQLRAAGVGVSLLPALALTNVREDIVVRSLGPRPPVRQIMAATLKDSFLSPAKQAMLDVLIEVGEEFAGKHRGLALAS